jgi:hypothetical protein
MRFAARRAASRNPPRDSHIAELANGAIGYIPNRSAYAEGNYEVVSARCAEGSGELLVQAAVNLSRLRRGLCFAASEIVVSSVGPSRSGVI